MPWLDQVAAVLVAWYPGQENGKAITPVLFGDENPSGKLPVTFPKGASDLPPVSTALNVPYSDDPQVLKRSPVFFDAQGMKVEQHFAVSNDGLRYESKL